MQITGGLYVGGGVFACPKQNCECNLDSDTESISKEGEQISEGSLWSRKYED